MRFNFYGEGNFNEKVLHRSKAFIALFIALIMVIPAVQASAFETEPLGEIELYSVLDNEAVAFSDMEIVAEANTLTIENYPPLRDGETISGQGGEGEHIAGQEAHIHAGHRRGYSFSGWTVISDVSGTVEGQLEGVRWHSFTHFVMPSSDVSLLANWTRIGDTVEMDAPVVRLVGMAIVWNYNENTEHYRIYVNGVAVKEVWRVLSYTFETLNHGDVIQVRAINGNHSNFIDSVRSDPVTFDSETLQPAMQLPTPYIYLSYGVIQWTPSQLASEYRIYMNGQWRSSTHGNSGGFWPSQSDIGMEIRVRAVGDGSNFLDSELSNAVTFVASDTAVPLEAPIIRAVGNLIIWDEASFRGDYHIYINGEMAGWNFFGRTSYVIAGLPDGTTIQVRAIGDGYHYLDSALSNAIVLPVETEPWTPHQLDAPVIRVDANYMMLTWDRVASASGYRVYVNGISQTDWNEWFGLYRTPNGATLQVRAVGGSNLVIDSELSNTIIFDISDWFPIRLATPSVRISDRTLSWTSVENATSYRISMRESEEVTETVVTETSFDLSGVADGVWISVTALGDNIDFLDSHSTSIIFNASAGPLPQLSAPIINIVGTNVSWQRTQQGAFGYRVYVNGVATATVVRNSSRFSVTGLADGTKLQVRAIGHTHALDSELSNAIIFDATVPPPPPPQLEPIDAPFLRIEGTTLRWDTVRGSVGYILYIDGVADTRATQGTGITFSRMRDGMTFAVRAISDGLTALNSELSNTVVFDITAAPPRQLDAPSLRVFGTTLSWLSVPDAVGYRVYRNGAVIETLLTETTFVVSEADHGANFRIRAIGDGNSTLNSALSNALVFNAHAAQPPSIASPVIGMTRTSFGITLNWARVDDSVGYRVYVDGWPLGMTLDAPRLSFHGPIYGTMFQVRALGDGINFSDSLPSNVVIFTTAPYNQLAAPVIDFTFENGSTLLSWAAISNAASYRVYFNHEPIGTVSATTLTFNIDDIVTSGVFHVRAIGDGHDFLDSDLSNPVGIEWAQPPTQLDAPVISIYDSTLSWTAVENAFGYRIYINGVARDGIFVGVDFIINETYRGASFSVRAISNNAEFADSEKSNEVVFPERPHNQLVAPIIESYFTNEGMFLVWNAVENASAYRVYLFGEAVGTTIEPIFNLTGVVGAEAELRVRALGDGVYFFDSYLGNLVSFVVANPQELPAPAISISGTTLSWSAVAAAMGYRIYINGVASEETITATTFNLAGLASGTRLQVRAIADGSHFEDSELSNEVTFTITTGQPQPQQLSAPVIRLLGTTLTWSAVSNAARYQVYLNGQMVGVASGTSFSFAQLTDGERLQVRAIGDGVNFSDSVLSNTVTFTVTTTPPTTGPGAGTGTGGSGGGTTAQVPSMPRDFVATPGDGSVTLGWRTPANTGGRAIARFEVSSDGGRTWISVGSELSYTFTGLINGNTYEFRVRAITSAGNGSQARENAMPTAPAQVQEDIPQVAPTVPPQQVPIVSDGLPFIDIDSSAWYYQSVRIAWENSLFSGTEPNLFSPQMYMTRAMFAQVLANLTNINVTAYANAQPSFDDVMIDAWYFGAIEWAAELGVVSGMGDGSFEPHSLITREQMALMLYRYANIMGIEFTRGEVVAFADQGAISHWAVEAVLVIQGAGIVTGRPDGTFDPSATATRAEVATIFARFLLMM